MLSPGGVVRRPGKGGFLARNVLAGQFRISLFVPHDLPRKELTAINRTLGNAGFTAALRRSVRQAVRQFPSLAKVRVRLSR
jgi:hypothetical protein